MKKQINSLLFLFGITPGIALAEATGLGGMAQNFVQGPLDALHRVMNGACILVGIVLIMMAFNLYRRHRRNPQEVPMSMPFIYCLLGVFLILLPFIYRLVKATHGA